jgi:hypothetical protein
MEDISATDINLKIEVQILRGTIVLNANGQPPTSIRITPRVINTAIDPGTQIISQLYEIEPSGTTFDPGATLIYRYSDSEIPEGITPENLFLAEWDPNQSQWIELDSGIDSVAHKVYAPIQHLSIYALLARNSPAEFEFSGITSSLNEVDRGETVVLSALVTNAGDCSGSCDVALNLDGETAQTMTVTLGGGESQTVTFNVTPSTAGEHVAVIGGLSVHFTVREELAPSHFITSNLSIYPAEIESGDSINIGILVTNTGDLPGTYHAVLYVANAEKASADIDLAGRESKNVSFSFTPEETGNYTVILGGLQAAFSVKTPAPAGPAPVELKINDFQITPTYNPDTDKLVLTRIDYQMDGTPEQLASSELVLKISLDGEYLEEISLMPLEGSVEGNSGSYSYIPSAGWKAGVYRFEVVLYQGGVFLQSSEQREFTATPEAVAAVFAWNIMGIVIGSVMVLAVIVVVLTVLKRRDMLRN